MAFLQALAGVLSSPPTLVALLTLIVAVWPSGFLTQVLYAIEDALLRWAKQHLPANQYAILQGLAHDAVIFAEQHGQALGLDDPAKAEAALGYLTSAAKGHKIGGFDETVLVGLIEQAYHELKTTLSAALPVAATTRPSSPASPVSPPNATNATANVLFGFGYPAESNSTVSTLGVNAQAAQLVGSGAPGGVSIGATS